MKAVSRKINFRAFDSKRKVQLQCKAGGGLVEHDHLHIYLDGVDLGYAHIFPDYSPDQKILCIHFFPTQSISGPSDGILRLDIPQERTDEIKTV